MGYVKLYGNAKYARIDIRKQFLSDSYIQTLCDRQLYNTIWSNSNSIIMANFNNSLSGNGAGYDFAGGQNFRVYKTIGNENPKLYKVYNTSNMDEKTAYDYIVGDQCDYQYFIAPICKEDLYGVEVERIHNLLKSNKVTITTNRITVLGLINSSSENEYIIDTSNIWCFEGDVSDGGSTLNTNKGFNDTQARYSQITASNRAYKTKKVKGILGELECETESFKNSFERIEAWDLFCASTQLKVLIDWRGRIFIGDIENNPTISYNADADCNVVVDFTFRELTNIDSITILTPSQEVT